MIRDVGVADRGSREDIVPDQMLGGHLDFGLAAPWGSPASPVAFVVAGNNQARRIMMFHFLTCQRRRQDACKPSACPHWVPITSGQRIEMAGQWCVFADRAETDFIGVPCSPLPGGASFSRFR